MGFLQTIRFYHAKNINSRLASAAVWFLIAALVTPLLAHAMIGGYMRFMADDFCSANATRNLGVLNAAWYWYVSWTGRYSANLLDSLNGLGGPRDPIHTAAAIAAWCAALLYLGSRLARPWAGKDRLAFIFLLAALLPAVTLATVPTVEQSVYFGQGMRSVVPPLIGMVLMAGQLADAAGNAAQTAARLWLRRIAMLCLAFLSAGFSETALVLQTGLLGLAASVWLLDRGDHRSDEVFRLVLVGLSGSLIGLAVMAFAPGNAFRKAFFPPTPDLPDLIRIMAQSFREFVTIYTPFSWQAGWSVKAHRVLDILTPWIVFALLGSGKILPGSATAAPRTSQLYTRLWLTPLAFIGLIFACFAPAAYGMSANIPGRAFIVPVFAATSGLAIWGYECGLALNRRPQSAQSQTPWMALVATGILVLLGLNSLWSARLVLKTQPTYAAYAETWSENDRRIARSRAISTDPVTLPAVINPVFGFSELTSDAGGVINQCMSGYYGIEVRTTAPPVP